MDKSTALPDDTLLSPDIAISVKNVSKKYNLYDSPGQRLREALHPFRKRFHHDFWALRDISFDVKKGGCLGIIGKNGCGKSTLLQIICRIIQPSEGVVSVNGRISALLELGAGFNPEFTGRENVYINGSLLGFTREEMDRRIHDIVSFADIGEFIDQAMKTYSSGMYVRLAFSAAISVKPEILVVDEALSVGDVFFQQKSFRTLREIMASGTTCLFVSHDTQAIMNLCDHALLLSDGGVAFEGTPEEAVSRYYSSMGQRAPNMMRHELRDLAALPCEDSTWAADKIIANSVLKPNGTRHGAGGLKIAAVRVIDSNGRDTLQVGMLEPLSFFMLLRALEDIHHPSAGIHIYDRLGTLVFSSGARQLRHRLPDLKSGEEIIVKIDVSLNVQPGEYTFSLGVSEATASGGDVAFLHDRCESLGPIVVRSRGDSILPFYGVAQLPMRVSHSAISGN